MLIAVSFAGKHYFSSQEKKKKKVLLKIIPESKSEKTPASAEQFFTIVHGIYKPMVWWEKFLQKQQPILAFEIVKIKGKICFFARVPSEYLGFIQSQLYAQYPEAEIEIAPEYFFTSGAKIKWARMQTSNSSLWPIKRYPQFEDTMNKTLHDPLSGILQSMSQGVSVQEFAGIQVAIQPFNDGLFRSRAGQTLETITSRKINKLSSIFEKTLLSFGFWARLEKLPLKIFLFLITFKKSADKISEESLQGEIKQSHERESPEQSAKDKMSRLVFQTDIRVFHAMARQSTTPFITSSIEASFRQFSIPYLNGFSLGKIFSSSYDLENEWKNTEIISPDTILSTEELATVIHLPHCSVENPDIVWVQSRKISAPHGIPTPAEKNITLLGRSNFRGQKTLFGIRPDDRRRHLYIAGKTGMGKSTLLENMIFSDIQNGKGVAVVDPHGDLADEVLEFIPKNRTNDVIWFDPSDKEFPISFNILECPNPEHKNLVASGVVGVFKKMFAESWGPRLEHILRNTLLALIEAGGQSLLGVLRILADEKYRKEILQKVNDPVVLSFWNDEFGRWQPRQVAEAISPIQNKVGQFLSSSLVRNILGQTKSSFSLRFAMDTKKIIVINLSKGKIGEDVSALLGAMMITKFQLDVMSRSDIKEKNREDFYLYVDEFQNFATQSFSTILSEARKYKLNLTVANQYLAQMDEEVRDAIFGNVGTLATFQVGYDDAKVLSEQFGGEDMITPADIGSLPKYQTYMRLMINGSPSPVFSCNTLPPPPVKKDEEQIRKIKNFSRERYAKPREKVEEQIKKWSWSAR